MSALSLIPRLDKHEPHLAFKLDFHKDTTVTTLRIELSNGSHWLDVVNPSLEEFHEIAERYQLSEGAVQASLQPDHLPKYEALEKAAFIILRSYDAQAQPSASTLQSLTRKVAIFMGSDFLVTIHRQDQEWISRIRDKWTLKKSGPKAGLERILHDFLLQAVLSFEPAIDAAIEQLDHIEDQIFQTKKFQGVIQEGYYLKRRASLIKRMLRLSTDTLTQLQSDGPISPKSIRDVREASDDLFFYVDDLDESINNILNLHVALESNRTNEASHRINEIMRVLTVFSAFFLPLNFIAGIYGMNFEFMPELKWHYGYAAVLTTMISVATLIYFWFRRRGWLK